MPTKWLLSFNSITSAMASGGSSSSDMWDDEMPNNSLLDSLEWVKDGTDYARWQKAQMQCTWCKKLGNYYYHEENTDDTKDHYNWIVTTMKEPGTLICNGCYARGRPPHVEYLTKLDKTNKKCFQTIGELINNVAEFAFAAYNRFSPEAIMENQESVNTNDEFPAGPKTGRREQARRSNY